MNIQNMKSISADHIVFLKFLFYWRSHPWEAFGSNFSFKICVLFCDEKWWEKDERSARTHKNYYFEKKPHYFKLYGKNLEAVWKPSKPRDGRTLPWALPAKSKGKICWPKKLERKSMVDVILLSSLGYILFFNFHIILFCLMQFL